MLRVCCIQRAQFCVYIKHAILKNTLTHVNNDQLAFSEDLDCVSVPLLQGHISTQ